MSTPLQVSFPSPSQIHRYADLPDGELAYALLYLSAGEPLPLRDDRATWESRHRLGIAGVPHLHPRRLVVAVVPTQARGKLLSGDLEFLGGGGESSARLVETFFGWEVLPFDALSPTERVSGSRLSALYRLLSSTPGIVLSTPDALLQRIPPRALFQGALIELRAGVEIDRDKLVSLLDSRGYIRRSLVEEVGQMSVRGSIVDLFTPQLSAPLRIEFRGPRIDALRLFEADTQRSVLALEAATVLPAREILLPWALNGDAGIELKNAVFRLQERANELDLSRRTVEPLEDVLRSGASWPGLEHLVPLLLAGTATLWEYLPPSAEVVLIDRIGVDNEADRFAELLAERAEQARHEGVIFPAPDAAFDSPTALSAVLAERVTCQFDSLPFLHGEQSVVEEGDRSVDLPRVAFEGNGQLVRALELARQEELPFRPLAQEIERRKGEHIAYVVDNRARMRRIQEILETYGIPAVPFTERFLEWREDTSTIGRVTLLLGSLSNGFTSPAEGIWILTDGEVFPETAVRRRAPSTRQMKRFLGALSQIRENDYIVHTDHGVGIYRGLKPIAVEGQITDFLTLEYAEGAKLFLPVENIGKIQKYIGGEGARPILSKLGGKQWAKTKGKVKEQVAELAGHLITLYAEREIVERESFGSENDDDLLFASAFPFQETPDQEKAIAEALRDLGGTRPMDRLICGDVGYGKTEVALRAAFKVVSAGKQAALLVPTTVLADQHFATVKERFRDFPVRVGCMSRFFSAQENRETLRALAAGQIDLIVGTHRLLQKDVIFHSLGLLIIDEEHRFGVKDKERLKRMRRDVDVMTLTATPIPRTLHLSLLDIRDLSVIETPPVDRQVIRTYVAPYQEGTVREAILRELGRGGQVFYIHNRVATIGGVAEEIAALVPEARIAFAHGQMRDDLLEEIMHRFIGGQVDVLLSTTIVESGLDIPNANTIVIREADKLGLAELYQLRGRVGRSSRRAYAYLLVSDPRTLGADAKKRLQVLQSLDDLGQGFRLALQDMEIRGAGNLLGKDQSGHIELVGFDLYSRILKETVRELRHRGETAEDELEVEPEMSVGLAAHIPEFYVPDVEERLLLYQRLSQLRDEQGASELRAEVEDRFGQLPREVEMLLELMVLRSVLKRHAVVSATYRNGNLNLSFHPHAPILPERVIEIVRAEPASYRLSPTGVLTLRVGEHLGASDLRHASERLLPRIVRQQGRMV